MKKLTHTVSGLEAIIHVTDVNDSHHHCLDFTATCGETVRRGRLTQGSVEGPDPERTLAHLEKEVADFAAKLAREAAGYERARLLKRKFLEG